MDEFAQAVAALIDDLGGHGRATNADLEAIRRRLERRIGRASSVIDSDEVISVSLARFTSAIGRGLVAPPPDGDPAGYLIRIVDHVVVDIGRSTATSRAVPAPTADLPEEVVLHELARQSSSEKVRSLLRAAREAGDTLGVRVLVAYLDTAATTDEVSQRRVAAAAGVSHPTVRAVLQRAAVYLETGVWQTRKRK